MPFRGEGIIQKRLRTSGVEIESEFLEEEPPAMRLIEPRAMRVNKRESLMRAENALSGNVSERIYGRWQTSTHHNIHIWINNDIALAFPIGDLVPR